MKETWKYLAVTAALCGMVVLGTLNAWATTNLSADLQVKQENTYTIASTVAAQYNILQDAGPSAGIAVDRGGGVASVIAAENFALIDGGTANATINGGSMRCYVWMPVAEAGQGGGQIAAVTFKWFPYPALDWTPTTGNQYAASGDKQSLSGIGRIVWLPDAVVTLMPDAGGGTSIIETNTARKGMPK